MKVFSSIIKSYKNLDELKENCLHLLPASYIKDDDQIKENDVKEFLNTTDFEKVFIGGSTCIKDDSEKILVLDEIESDSDKPKKSRANTIKLPSEGEGSDSIDVDSSSSGFF